MWQRQIHNAWRSGKRILGHAFHHAVKFAGQLDHTVNVGKRLFSALSPAIQDYAPGATQPIVQAFGRYEQGRDDVMGGYNKVQAQLSQVRRAVPEIDFD